MPLISISFTGSIVIVVVLLLGGSVWSRRQGDRRGLCLRGGAPLFLLSSCSLLDASSSFRLTRPLSLQPFPPPPSSSSILSSSPFSTILPNSATINSMLCPERRSDPHPPVVPRSPPPGVAAASFSSSQSSQVRPATFPSGDGVAAGPRRPRRATAFALVGGVEQSARAITASPAVPAPACARYFLSRSLLETPL